MKPARLHRLPEDLRREIRAVRGRQGWSQAEFGRRIGLLQAHVDDAGQVITAKASRRTNSMTPAAPVSAATLAYGQQRHVFEERVAALSRWPHAGPGPGL